MPPTPSPSLTPRTDENIVLRIVDNRDWVEVFVGPGRNHAVRALLYPDQTASALGKSPDEAWIYVYLENEDLNGWVEASQAILVNGELTNLPVMEETNPPPEDPLEPSCEMTVRIEVEESGDHYVIWNNQPDETTKLILTVTGQIDREREYLVHPNEIDPADEDTREDGFLIGRWLFGDRGFSRGTTYAYSLQALDESNNILCERAGTFER
jgi:hypothetical protein